MRWRRLEGVALAMAVVQLLVTRVWVGTAHGVEANPLMAWAIQAVGWYPIAAAKLGVIAGVFVGCRLLVERDGWAWPARYGLWAFVSVVGLNLANDVWAALSIGAPETVLVGEVVLYAGVVSLVAIALWQRQAIQTASAKSDSPGTVAKKAGAVVLVFTLVIASPSTFQGSMDGSPVELVEAAVDDDGELEADFEDGNPPDLTIGRDHEVISTTVLSDSKALATSADSSDLTGYSILGDETDYDPDSITFEFYTEVSSFHSDHFIFAYQLRDDAGTIGPAVGVASGSGAISNDPYSLGYDSGSWQDTGVDLQPNTAYLFEISNIDYSSNTYDFAVYNMHTGSTVYSKTGVSFDSDSNGGTKAYINAEQGAGGGDSYFDDFDTNRDASNLLKSTVSGTVSTQSGGSCSNCEVVITDQSDGSTVTTTTTNSSGDWSASVSDGSYTASVDPPRYTANSTDFTVSGSDLSNIDLTVEREYKITGRVTNQSGAPLDDAIVVASDGPTGGPDTRTNATGHYELWVVAGDWTLTAIKNGYAQNETDLTVSGNTTQDFTLKPSGAPYVVDASPRSYQRNRSVTLQARVLDDQQNPVWATIYWQNQSGGYEAVGSIANESSGTYVTAQVQSRPGPNKWYVVATDQVSTRTSQVFTYKVPNDLKIRYRDGTTLRPVTNTTEVVITSTESNYRVEKTTSDGDLSLNGVPNEDLSVTVDADGYATETAPIWDPTVAQIVTLEPTGATPGSDDTINQSFTLNDQTGQFPPSKTRLIAQVYANGSWVSAGSGLFGSTNQVTLTMTNGADYRLRVETTDGRSCQLETFTFQDAQYADPIQITLDDTCLADDGGDDGGENEPPIAEFDYTPSAPTTGAAIAFNATASRDPDGTIQAVEWDLNGDGTYEASGLRTGASYNSGGNYTVGLRVTDDDGTTDTTSRRIYVAGTDEPPTARFTWNRTAPVKDEPIQFDASNATDDGTITAYNWTFTDRTSFGTIERTGVTTTQTFSSAGTVVVSLTVRDDVGNADSLTQSVYIGANASDATQRPTPRISVTPQAPAPTETVTLDGTASTDPDGSITEYNWTIQTAAGDRTVTGSQVTHNWTTNGTYDVTLTVTDDRGTQNATTTEVVVGRGEPTAPPNQAPIARFNVTPTNPAPAEVMTLNASSSSDPDGNLTAYRWDLDNDGKYEKSGRVINHSYAEGGLYQVSLTVTDEFGQTDTTTKAVQVGDGDPTDALVDWSAEWVDANDSDTEAIVAFKWSSSGEVSAFRYRLYRQGNRSDPLVDERLGAIESVAREDTVNASYTWVVLWNATVNGEQLSGQKTLGGVGRIDLPIDADWLELFAMVVVAAIAGLVAGVMHWSGGLVITAVAWGIQWFGWYDFGMIPLTFATVLALMFSIAGAALGEL